MGKMISEADLANPEFTTGFLFYDVPQTNSRMGNLLRRLLRPFAMWPNKSVVTFPWKNAALVEGAVLEVREVTGQTASAYMMPLTDVSRPYLVRMIADAAKKEFDRLVRSLNDRIKAVPGHVQKMIEQKGLQQEDAPKAILRRRKAVYKETRKKVEELVGHGVALALQDQFAGWAQVARNVLDAERTAIETYQKSLKSNAVAV